MTTMNGNSHHASLTPKIDPAIILQPNDLPAVSNLLQQIQAQGNSLLSNDVSPPSTLDSHRLNLLQSARTLVLALEKPRETMIRHCWSDTAAFSILSLGIEAGIWSSLASGPSCSSQPKHVKEILSSLPAPAQNFSYSFLSRILKHAAAMGYIHETAQDTYLATNFIKALTIPIIGAGYNVFSGPKNTGGSSRPIFSLSSWLKENDYQEPGSSDDLVGPFQYGHGTELNMFQWFRANKPADEQFNYHMAGYSHGRPNWFDEEVYPVRERLVKGFDGEGVLLVDIAGGLGQDTEAFAKRFPDVGGRLVLQDLEHVIAQGKAGREGGEASRVEREVYDFHTEQPVKGARAYYLHSVLHDWSDEVCVSILKNAKAAMKAGYSRLLINENAIPETGAHWEMTGLDMVIAPLLSSRERTRVEWMRLLEGKAGFKVTKIYHYLGDPKTGVESLIECELV